MPDTAVQPTPDLVRSFVQEYFDAWKGTDEQRILAYYADDVVIDIPTGTLNGKNAVRDNFVRPFITGFPGNIHAIRNLAHAANLVAVEWSFDGEHRGPFANVPATHRRVRVPGCSFYQYDFNAKLITAGRIYFDFATLMEQISV